ncbi:MAG: hypothetical protein WDO17_28805 [Alphaproteobacteria bacterium]
MYIGHSGLDELAELELLLPFADLDGAQFARPVVDVLKKVTMDGAKVLQVEIVAGDPASNPQRDERAFLFVEKSRIGDAEPVSKNGRTWIDVRIASAAHFATAAGLRARM